MDRAQPILAVLTALTPTVAIFLATLIQRQDVRDLRSDVNSFKNQMNSDMLTLRKDMNAEMVNLRKDLGGEMVNLRNQVHADLLLIHERVAKVEAKQGE